MSDQVTHSLLGEVLRCSSDKTLIVRVTRREKHPVYHKFINRYTDLMVHDEKNEGEVGMQVTIKSCRPYSKRKRWALVSVAQKKG